MTINELERNHRPSLGGLRARKINCTGPDSRELARRMAAWIEKGEQATDPDWMATCYWMANRYARQLEAIQMGGAM